MNNQTNDFFTLYQEKCKDYEALQNELNEMKDLGQLIEKELESEIEVLSHEKQKIIEKNQELQSKLQELKKNYSSEIGFYERKTDQMVDENTKMKEELKSKNRIITQNEIEIENLESQLRISQMEASNLECQIENTLERLGIVHSQLEETKACNEEEVQRLKDRLQESQNEILAFKRREAMMKKFEEMRSFKMLTGNQNIDNLATDPAKHYGAYQGKGGDDPAPFKKLKVELGKRGFGHFDYESNNQNPSQRAFKPHYQSGRSQRIANMNEQGVEGIGRTQGFELFQQNAELFGQGFYFGN